MKYSEALEYINSDDKRGHHPGLENIKRLLSLLDNPQDDLKFIHLTGTNGKGSTANFISLLLEEKGYKVGLFTSPHILKLNERFKINHIEIEDDDFTKYIETIRAITESDILDFIPTYFEITVAVALLYFRDNRCDYVVFEVGIGGKNDPTNIISTTIASVFTPISLDHTERLGESPELIAKEKSMIIKKDSVAISYKNSPSIDSILTARARELGSDIFFLNDEDIEIIKSDIDGILFKYKGRRISIPILGSYQAYNLSLALLTLEKIGIDISTDEINSSLKKIAWPARMNKLSDKPIFIVDGAHNEHGFKALFDSISNLKYKKLILGIGIMKDKMISNNLRNLVDKADIVLLTKIDYERAMDESELKQIFPGKDCRTINKLEDCIRESIELADKDDLILFCGSLYMAGEIINIVNSNSILKSL